MVLTIAIRPGMEAWLLEVFCSPGLPRISCLWVPFLAWCTSPLVFGEITTAPHYARVHERCAAGVQCQLHRAAILPCIGDSKHVQHELMHCLLRKSTCSMAVTCRTGAFITAWVSQTIWTRSQQWLAALLSFTEERSILMLLRLGLTSVGFVLLVFSLEVNALPYSESFRNTNRAAVHPWSTRSICSSIRIMLAFSQRVLILLFLSLPIDLEVQQLQRSLGTFVHLEI